MIALLTACARLAPSTDGSFTASLGDDDDAATVPDPTDTAPVTPCAEAGFEPVPEESGQALVDALHALTDAQFCNDYPQATEWMFLVLDNVDGFVECVYTGREVAVNGAKPDPTDMNTEHSWPQSMGADTFPAECDLHHLYPTDSATNTLRGNWPYGEVVDDTESVDGGSRFGTDADGDTVFEPRDVHKGNAARSMLYFAMRYGYDLSADELALYRAWDAQDPVEDREIQRSLDIAARQGAANPYVVCQGLVDRL